MQCRGSCTSHILVFAPTLVGEASDAPAPTLVGEACPRAHARRDAPAPMLAGAGAVATRVSPIGAGATASRASLAGEVRALAAAPAPSLGAAARAERVVQPGAGILFRRYLRKDEYLQKDEKANLLPTHTYGIYIYIKHL